MIDILGGRYNLDLCHQQLVIKLADEILLYDLVRFIPEDRRNFYQMGAIVQPPSLRWGRARTVYEWGRKFPTLIHLPPSNLTRADW